MPCNDPTDGPTVTPTSRSTTTPTACTGPTVSEIHLTPIEWALLAHLAQRPGRLVTHKELLRAVWGPEYLDETNYLRVHITHLRKKIEPDPANPMYVITETGRRLPLHATVTGAADGAVANDELGRQHDLLRLDRGALRRRRSPRSAPTPRSSPCRRCPDGRW